MTKVVISKKFNGSAISVDVVNDGLRISMDLNSFINTLAAEYSDDIARLIASHAGNPSLLLTNQQLQDRLANNVDVTEVATALCIGAEKLVGEMKQASIVAV